MKGIIYLRVALYLETDVTEEEVQDIVQEVDYEFNHPLVAETKIQEILTD